MQSPRFIMLGGFLGAGKTTTLLHLALHLQRLGVRVGLITNDQADGLVDTALAAELQLPVREITGGCFCCRSETLVDALARLTAERQPEVFLAEPVGSCMDLVATVSLPLERIYDQGFAMAPYAVLVDPFRALQTLGVDQGPLRTGAGFTPDINYIYRKQLEEAEIIVINKIDVVSLERLTILRKALQQEYPHAEIMEVASRDALGLEPLFTKLLTSESKIRSVMEVDYVRYGRGEALLGWVNGSWELKTDAKKGLDGDALLQKLIEDIQNRLNKQGSEVAHLKGTLTQTDTSGMAAVSLVRSDGPAEPRMMLGTAFTKGQLLLNLRAEGDPELLADAVQQAVGDLSGVRVRKLALQSFRPGKPSPTHRVAQA
jgi:G3E family GTPase